MATPISEAAASHSLGPVERIPLGEGREFKVGAIEVAVFRTRSGQIYALQARCPHRGGPLADGLLGYGKVVCPLHAYCFDLETGDPLQHECPGLRRYPVETGPDGELLIHLEQPSTGAE